MRQPAKDPADRESKQTDYQQNDGNRLVTAIRDEEDIEERSKYEDRTGNPTDNRQNHKDSASPHRLVPLDCAA